MSKAGTISGLPLLRLERAFGPPPGSLVFTACCAVWSTPGSLCDLCGLHIGPQAWGAIQDRLGGQEFRPERDRLRWADSFYQARQFYLEEATRYGAPTPPPLYQWQLP